MPPGNSRDDQIVIDADPSPPVEPVSSNTRSKTCARTSGLADDVKDLTKICDDKNVFKKTTPGGAAFEWNEVFPQSDKAVAGGLWGKHTGVY